jgi:hypothetical protein
MIALTLLLLALPALVTGNSLETVEWQTSPETATVSLRLQEPVQPRIRMVPINNCWQVDFVGISGDGAFPGGSAENGPIRLIQVDELRENPPIQRLSCYVRPNVQMKCVLEGNMIHLSFRFSEQRRNVWAVTGSRKPQPLILPQTEKQEITIRVKNSPFEPLIAELSRQTFPLLKFRDSLPATVSVGRTFRSHEEALTEILRQNQYVLTRETDGVFVNHKNNPLLLIPGDDQIRWKSLAGLPIRECLTRVLGDRAGMVGSLLPPGVAAEKFPEFDLITSSRRWAELLLQAWGDPDSREQADA